MYESILEEPKMKIRKIVKPTFQFVYKVFIDLLTKIGYGDNNFDFDELDQTNFTSIESKINFLNQII